MSEEEEQRLNGHSHSLGNISHAGDGPIEIARQMREAGERAGSYVPSDGFIRIRHVGSVFLAHQRGERIPIGVANENIYNKKKRDKNLTIMVENSLTSFGGGDTMEMRDSLSSMDNLVCYLCERRLDVQYCFIIKNIKDYLPLKFKHVCCYCDKWVSNPEEIKNITVGGNSPFIIIKVEHTGYIVNVFHLIRYLGVIDQHKANAVRKKFEEYEVSLNPKILRDFYK